MANPLRPEAILQAMADALPTHDKADPTSDLSSSYEALALFTHACMVSLGFRLLGFNEDQKTETECASLAPRLPSRWNASFNSHSFLYAHTQSSLRFILKVDRLGAKAEIRGLGVGDERIHRLELTAQDYVSSAALPLRIARGPDGAEDRATLPAQLGRVFISRERIVDLASLVKVAIIQRLVPALHKDGYEEAADPDDRAALEDADRVGRQGPGPGQGQGQQHPPPPQPPRMPDPLPDPVRPYPFNDPLAPRGRPRVPPGDFAPPEFEDEYETYAPARRLGGLGHPQGRGSPFGIGHDDLNPPWLGPHDPLRPSFIGGGGLPRPGGGGSGGMHPTFDDPLFGGRHGGGGGDGDGGFDPQIPPGARYDDPVGGFGALPRFGGGQPRGGGRGNNPFGGDII